MNPGKRMLLTLAALFAAPLAIAFFLYYGHPTLRPSASVNHGVLISPARPLSIGALPLAAGGATAADLLRHKWTLIYVGEGACNDACRKALYDTRQVRIALDRDMLRVQRLFLATGACCDLAFFQHEHPDLIVVRADESTAPLQRKLQESVPGATGGIYVVDPLSNLMMSYGPQVPAKGLLEDLKRLLKLSQIG